jgi:prepilin-type N-terminal cleavage/methylation domain-containing protein
MNPHTKIARKTTVFGVGVKRGMTLVEVVMAMVIIAIAFYALVAAYATTSQRNINVETINEKLYLAQEKMEEYLTLPFASIVTTSPSPFASANFTNYNYRIVTTLVATSDLTTSVGSSPYKKVQVMVWGGQPSNSVGTVELDSLVTTF